MSRCTLWYGVGMPSDPLSRGAGVEVLDGGLVRLFVKDGAARSESVFQTDIEPFDSIRLELVERGADIYNVDQLLGGIRLPRVDAAWPVGGEAKLVVL